MKSCSEHTLGELVFVLIAHSLVADGLVDAIRGRIREIREQETVPAAFVEQKLAQARNTSAGVAPPAVFGRGVDEVEPDTVWSRPGIPGHRDGFLVLPEMDTIGPHVEEGVDTDPGLLSAGVFSLGFLD